MFDTHMLLTLMALVYSAALLCIGYVLLTYRTSHAALAWILGLIAFPYLTLILFAFFGRNRFQGYVAARRSGDYELQPIANQIHWPADPTPLPAELQPLLELANTPVLLGNHTRVHRTGEHAFQAMFEAIDRAERYVLLQFYIVRHDSIGRVLQQRLLNKLAQGVQVYFLYDDWGSSGLARSYINQLEQQGARMYPFNTPRRYLKRLQLNFRNHRKTLICDGHTAFVGGFNVGDEYLGKNPALGPWRDTQLEVTGPATTALQLCFLEDWYWASNQIPNLEWTPPLSQTTPTCPLLVVPSSAADDAESCTLLFLSLINSARERLWIATPYFVPDVQIMHALQLAVMRGVDVCLLVPARPDHRTIYYACQTFLDDAVQFGAHVYQYRAGFLHQKVLLVDAHCAAVGTANLDNRSMRLNFEITLLGFGTTFIQDIRQDFEEDFRHAHRMRPHDYAERSLPFKLICRSARLLAPLL